MPNHTDFNGDGRDDIFWRSNWGEMMEWLGQADGGFVNNLAAKYPFPLDWHVVGTGDFNGDGHDDVLFRNLQSGSVTEWLGQDNGAFFSNHAVATYSLPTAWYVAGTGDFNGDGRADLLLRHDNGAVTNWTGQTDGGFVSNHAAASYTLPSGWNVAGTGDFDGDGRDDILLRHDNGAITNWLGQANGSFVSNHATASYTLPSGWNVAGTGDFDGDGQDDVLLRHSNGTVTEWLGQSDGGFFSNHVAANYALDIAWGVVGIGDFNGDAHDDVLLRHSNGTVTNWLGQENGAFFSNHAVANYGPLESTWQVQPNPSGAGVWDY